MFMRRQDADRSAHPDGVRNGESQEGRGSNRSNTGNVATAMYCTDEARISRSLISAQSFDIIDRSTSYAIVASENNANVVVAPTGEMESALEREYTDPKGRRLDNKMDVHNTKDSEAKSSDSKDLVTVENSEWSLVVGATSSSTTRRSGMNKRGKAKKDQEETAKDTKSDPAAKPQARARTACRMHKLHHEGIECSHEKKHMPRLWLRHKRRTRSTKRQSRNVYSRRLRSSILDEERGMFLLLKLWRSVFSTTKRNQDGKRTFEVHEKRYSNRSNDKRHRRQNGRIRDDLIYRRKTIGRVVCISSEQSDRCVKGAGFAYRVH